MRKADIGERKAKGELRMKKKLFGKRAAALFLAAVMAVPGALTASAGVMLKETTKEAAEEGSNLSWLLHNLGQYEQNGESQVVHDLAETNAEKVTGVEPCMPAEGDVNTLVIFTEFQDYKFDPEFKKELKENIFKDVTESDPEDPNYPKDSLRAYYQRASFGKLNIGGEFIEYESEHERSWYDEAAAVNEQPEELWQEALDDWADKIISQRPDTEETDREYLNNYLSRFDQNNDMEIDGCYLACAGGNTGWGSVWWGYRTGESTVKIGDYSLNHIIQVVDTLSKPGVAGQDDLGDYVETFIHETGHQLGLLDYYSYGDQGVEKMEGFAMMNENNGDQDGFAKMLLGWLPKERVQFVTQDSTVKLMPYASTGDIAVILPKEEYEQHGIYSQFILAEHYKDELNDNITKYISEGNNRVKRPLDKRDGLRFYHVYARLNKDETEFLASNEEDNRIPLIADYVNPDDVAPEGLESLGFYRKGAELTPKTDPSTFFYADYVGSGLLNDSLNEDSGISITDISEPSGDGTMSFTVDFADKVEGPMIKDVSVSVNAEGADVLRATFDQPVNIGTGQASVYDYDAKTDSCNQEEPWGIGCKISMPSLYTKHTNYVEIMVDSLRYTRGVLVLPRGAVYSSGGVASPAQTYVFSNLLEGMGELKASPEGGNYKEGVKVTISGAPAGSQIYYTLNNKEPDLDSTVYDGPITIDRAAVLKAVALDQYGIPVTDRLRETYDLANLTLNRDKVTLDVGESYYLNYECTWNGEYYETWPEFKSSDDTVVYVNDSGMLLGRKEGTATVTVSIGLTEASCEVTVEPGAARAVTDALYEAYGRSSDKVRAEIIEALNGRMTLKEFAQQGYLSKPWIGGLYPVVYSGMANEQDPLVYDGIRKLTGGEDYTLAYSNNVNAGKATVTAALKGKFKGRPDASGEFDIYPARLGTQLIGLDVGVKYDGKAKTPVPFLLWDVFGEVTKMNKKDFKITYLDSQWNEVGSVKAEGQYYAVITSRSPNYNGEAYLNIYVQKKNIVEQLKIKKKAKVLKLGDEPVEPRIGKDYKIIKPHGYVNSAASYDGTLLDEDLSVDYYNNDVPGKMTMILKGREGSPYKGTQVVTFRIK